MAYEVDYDDLDYGDETRGEGLQTVGLPHGAPEDGPDYSGSNDPVEGMIVSFDGSEIKAADVNGTDGEFGVLYTYKYFGDSSHDGPYIRGDRNATVAVGGKLKVHVDADVVAGDTLEAGDSSASPAGVPGVLTTSSDDSANFVALTDAKQQGTRPDDSDAYYAEVLVR